MRYMNIEANIVHTLRQTNALYVFQLNRNRDSFGTVFFLFFFFFGEKKRNDFDSKLSKCFILDIFQV